MNTRQKEDIKTVAIVLVTVLGATMIMFPEAYALIFP